jgi:hypothetical protein
VDLDDIGLPLAAQIADGTWRAAAGEEFDLAGDFAGAGIVAAKKDLVPVFAEESARLDHDPVRTPVDGAGQMVEEQDAHSVGRMRGGRDVEQPEQWLVRWLGGLVPGSGVGGRVARGASVREDPAALVGSHGPPLAGRKVPKIEGADADAQETEGRVADGCSHAAHLTVLSLDQFEFEPAVGDTFPEADGWIPRRHRRLRVQQTDLAWTCAVSLDGHAGSELAEGVRGGDPFDLGPVGAGVAVFGIEETAVEAGFVAEEEETLGVRVEATQGIHLRREPKAVERTVGGTIRSELAEDAAGLVEGNQHGAGVRRSPLGCGAR